MRFFILSLFLFLSACETRMLNSAQDITVDLVGTDTAYCILSTKYNRYALNAPGSTKIERSYEDLKIDCRDNAIQRRRTMTVKSEMDDLYYRYPEQVTVDFSVLENGNRFNGYRANPTKIIKSENTVLTEDSYSKPMKTEQVYPVKKEHVMGRRSYPMPLTSGKYKSTEPNKNLTPMIDSLIASSTEKQPLSLLDPSVITYPIR